MSGFLKFCAVVGTGILAVMGVIVILTGVVLLVPAIIG